MFRGLCVSVVILSVAKVMVKGLVTETPASDADAYSTPPAPVTDVVLTTTCSHSNGTPVADPSDLRYFYSILEGDSTLFSILESPVESSQWQTSHLTMRSMVPGVPSLLPGL